MRHNEPVSNPDFLLNVSVFSICSCKAGLACHHFPSGSSSKKKRLNWPFKSIDMLMLSNELTDTQINISWTGARPAYWGPQHTVTAVTVWITEDHKINSVHPEGRFWNGQRGEAGSQHPSSCHEFWERHLSFLGTGAIKCISLKE